MHDTLMLEGDTQLERISEGKSWIIEGTFSARGRTWEWEG